MKPYPLTDSSLGKLMPRDFASCRFQDLEPRDTRVDRAAQQDYMPDHDSQPIGMRKIVIGLAIYGCVMVGIIAFTKYLVTGSL